MVKWSVSVKGAMAEVLREDYMSSEESQYETDSENVNGYLVKPLGWESKKLERRKHKLDKAYKDAQTARSQKRMIKRIRIDQCSKRPCPQEFPQWACKEL
jgi:hypothetical protein